MIQEIIDGIIKAIRTEYDKSFRIYTESVEQGLKEPCFSIICISGQNDKGVGSRTNRLYPFNITYFPSTDEPRLECLKVMESLYDVFDVIDVGSARLRGTGMNGDIVDGVLQFQVSFGFFLLATKVETNMDDVQVNTDGKE